MCSAVEPLIKSFHDRLDYILLNPSTQSFAYVGCVLINLTGCVDCKCGIYFVVNLKFLNILLDGKHLSVRMSFKDSRLMQLSYRTLHLAAAL